MLSDAWAPNPGHSEFEGLTEMYLTYIGRDMYDTSNFFNIPILGYSHSLSWEFV